MLISRLPVLFGLHDIPPELRNQLFRHLSVTVERIKLPKCALAIAAGLLGDTAADGAMPLTTIKLQLVFRWFQLRWWQRLLISLIPVVFGLHGIRPELRNQLIIHLSAVIGRIKLSKCAHIFAAGLPRDTAADGAMPVSGANLKFQLVFQ